MGQPQAPIDVTRPAVRPRNRVAAVMEHTARYSFSGAAKLAQDAGVSRSAVSRLLSGKTNPSAGVLLAVTRALEARIGRPLDPRELLTFDGTFPTESVCRLVGCTGCLPERAYREDGSRKPDFETMRPGTWTGLEPMGDDGEAGAEMDGEGA